MWSRQQMKRLGELKAALWQRVIAVAREHPWRVVVVLACCVACVLMLIFQPSQPSVDAETLRDLEKLDKFGRTPLYLAVDAGDLPRVKLLLRAGANINVKDNRLADWGERLSTEQTILHIAAWHGDPAMVSHLVAHGAWCNAVGFESETPLMWAARFGHVQAMTVLIGGGAHVATARDRDGWSALHWAAEYGRDKAVEVLLRSQLRARSFPPSSCRCEDAARAGACGEAKGRAPRGNVVDAANVDGATPMMLAAAAGIHRSRYFEDDDFNNRKYATPGHARAVDLLLHAGANISAADREHRTALHYASEAGSVEIVELLLRRLRGRSLLGEVLHAQDVNGRTPLHTAARNGHALVVGSLLKAAAASSASLVRVVDRFGRTARDLAARQGMAAAVDALQQHDP